MVVPIEDVSGYASDAETEMLREDALTTTTPRRRNGLKRYNTPRSRRRTVIDDDDYSQTNNIPVLVTEWMWDDDLVIVRDAVTKIADLCYGLTSDNHAETNRRKIASVGGNLSLVRAMRKYSYDAELMAECCRCIRNLATRNDDNRFGLAEAGGIGSVLFAMKSFPNDHKVQRNGKTSCPFWYPNS